MNPRPAPLLPDRTFRSLLTCSLLIIAGLAQAANLYPPTITRVSETISGNSGNARAFLVEFTPDSRSTDENLYLLYMRMGNSNFEQVDVWLPGGDPFRATYLKDTYLSGVADLTTFGFQMVACKAEFIYDANGQIESYKTTNLLSSAFSARKDINYRTSAQDTGLDAPNSLSVTFPDLVRNGQTVMDGSVVAKDDSRLRIQFGDQSDREDWYRFLIKKATDASYPSSYDRVQFPFNLSDFTLSNGAFLYKTTTVGSATVATSGLEPGETYKMKIRAAFGYPTVTGTVSADSNEVTFTMPEMRKPLNFTATAVDEFKIALTWQDDSNVEHGYAPQWKADNSTTYNFATNSTSGNLILANPNTGSMELNSATMADTLIPGLPLTWHIAAYYNPASNQILASPQASNLKLSASTAEVRVSTLFLKPENLQGTSTFDTATNTETINLTWQDKSARETGYRVLFSTNGGTTFSTAADLAANTQNFSFTVATPGIAHQFKVLGYYDINGTIYGTTADSNVVTITSKNMVTSRTYQPATVGSAMADYQVTTTGAADRTSWSIANLPAGLSFNTTTGVLSGTPQTGGLFVCPISATFNDGWTATLNLNLRILYPAAAPTLPETFASRSMPPGGTATIPLSEMFADRDTEQAVRVTTNLGSIDFILFPTETPLTVANFMAYVNAGDYNGSIFHRNSPGFVLQGGGYKPASTGNAADFDEITRRASPKNEPGISNAMGTISLAKGSTPDSGSHDFFINLGNNVGLDNPSQAGGFTAFGRVAGFTGPSTSRTTIDAILALPGSMDYSINLKPSGSSSRTTITPLSADLGAGTIWPINDTTAPAAIDNTKMVTITSVTQVSALMNYQITTAPDSGIATAAIVDGNFVITGVTEGATSVVIQATDLDGQTSSQTIALNVVSGYALPVINIQPQAQSGNPGTSVMFSVTATGANLSYQWRKGGVNLPGQTESSLTLNNISASDQGTYTVKVSNFMGNVVSDGTATLTVNSPAVITSPTAPQSLARNFHSSTSFTAAATGLGTITYQWKKGGTDVTDGARVSGANSPTLTITGLELTDAGDYTCTVSNSFGNATSPAFTLTVTRIDTDGDGLKDDEELARVPPTSINSADTDGDGYADGLEVTLGTSPTLASSNPGTTTYVAARDGATTLGNLALKRVTGTTTFFNRLTSSSGPVPDLWLMKYELTNEEFASLLDHAVRVKDVAEVVSISGRDAVRYPKSTGQIVCYLAETPSSSAVDPSCDITYDARSRTFHVAKALIKMPARAISWYGAYLATVALNDKFGYTQINTSGFTFSANANHSGFLIPTYTAWEWAARGGSSPGLLYPTGATVSTSLAKYNDTTTSAKPKVVGSYAASKLGFYDLGGNVAEWIQEDDVANAGNAFTRGGGFSDTFSKLDNTSHDSLPKTAISAQIGVRLAMREAAAPVFAPALVDQLVKLGETITITTAITSAPTVKLQWYKNGVAMAGKTAATLTIPTATTTDAAAYMLKATAQGVTSSTTCRVAVIKIANPAPIAFIVPQKAFTLSPTVTLAPGQTLKYQWYRNGSAAGNVYHPSGDKAKSINVTKAISGLDGTYQCVVSPSNSPTDLEVATFYITLYNVPIVDSSQTALNYAAIGRAYSQQLLYKLTAGSGSPDEGRTPTKWTITGLPKGLTYNSLTGLIYGVPTEVGTFSIKITASNPFSSSTQVVMSLEVVDHPLKTIAQGSGTTKHYFTGLVERHNIATSGSTGVNDNQGGRIDITAESTGSCSGKLVVAGTTLNFPPFNLEPQFTTANSNTDKSLKNELKGSVVVPRPGRLSLKVDLTATYADPHSSVVTLTGTVGELPSASSTPTTTAAIAGWRNKYTIVDTTSTRQGYKTFALGAPAGQTNADTVPQGYTYGTMSVAASGGTVVAGKMADDQKGSAFTCSSYMSPTGVVLLYQSLYGGTGSVMGRFGVGANQAITIADSITWSRKNQGTASTSRSYKTGFPSILNLQLISGGGFVAPATGHLLMELPTPSGSPLANAALVFSDGGIGTNAFNQLVHVPSTNIAALASPIAKSTTFTVSKTTGLFSGTFTLVDDDPTSSVVGKNVSRLVYFYGAIVPHPSSTGKGIGYGFFNLPKLPDSTHIATKTDMLSGKVVFDVKP